MEHFIIIMVVGMAVATGATILLLTHSASLVSVAFGSGLLMGLFTGAYLYRVGSKLFHK